MCNNKIKITCSNGEFNCRVLGKGKKCVIAFHGFGQDGNAFFHMSQSLPQLTIYAVDLPFHGETKIHEGSAFFSDENLVELVEKLLQENKLENFSILAYSIGVKCVSPIIESFDSKIDYVWLLAPDGIAENFWYKFSMSSKLTRYFFQELTNRSQGLLRLVNFGAKIKIVNAETAALVLRSISTNEKAKRVYHTWAYFRKLKIDVSELAQVMNSNEIQLQIFLGDRDQVISRKQVIKKCKGLNDIEIFTISCTHNQLISNFAKWFLHKID